jgi:hypothetical protein
MCYPGIVDMLSVLRDDGHWLSIVTAKPLVYARRIIEHLGIDALVPRVLGPDLSARRYTKETLIRRACAEWGISTGGVVVGDRADDVSGAKANALQAIGVTWGYGSVDELRAARPDRLVDQPADVVDVVRLVSEAEKSIIARTRRVAQVIFWTAASRAATRIPMGPKQIAAEVARVTVTPADRRTIVSRPSHKKR